MVAKKCLECGMIEDYAENPRVEISADTTYVCQAGHTNNYHEAVALATPPTPPAPASSTSSTSQGA